ncbi:hypothetical protein Poli38472_003084 [Pythium oligandrum]|uniref:Uncharacterized protein n=1 Tax=Pythium oligandrum TaxID=41045 RepID=A0A8K1C5W3_PYTOL|nr:hypothetical protein Poli38472_003084 [Pythium oligandrum]|eukprot:TMW57159.1 hypothetical protein Poli38472_003084 [Pythium oligandrum]
MTMSTHGAEASARTGGTALGGAGSASHGDQRWKTSAAKPQMNSSYRNIVMLEKRKRSNEMAAKEMSHSLMKETLTGLRQKAADLQNDKWMYEDVRI